MACMYNIMWSGICNVEYCVLLEIIGVTILPINMGLMCKTKEIVSLETVALIPSSSKVYKNFKKLRSQKSIIES